MTELRKRRVAVVGLDHYHTTGWVESLELFADELDIVAIYEPDETLRDGLAPRFYDPHLSARLSDRYRPTPRFGDLNALSRARGPISPWSRCPNVPLRMPSRSWRRPVCICWSTNPAQPTGRPRCGPSV